MKFNKEICLIVAGAVIVPIAIVIHDEWRVPLAVLSSLRQAEKGNVCEMRRELHGHVYVNVLSGRCIELRPEDLRNISELTRRRIFWNPIKSRTEGICSDFVSPDSQIQITSKVGDILIQIQDDRCWMVMRHMLGVIQITNPEMVRAMPNFISAQASHGR